MDCDKEGGSSMMDKEFDTKLTTNNATVDNVLLALKPLGWYQRISILCIFVGFLQMAHTVLIHVFIGYTPDFQCRNASKPWTEYGINLPNNSYSVEYGQCHVTIKENNTDGHQTELACPNGYHFSSQQIRSTIITEWDMVCDRQGLGELSQTLVMVGQIVGAIFLSPLPDRYGRKPVMVVGQVLAFALGVSASFSPTYAVFCVLRFLVGVVIQDHRRIPEVAGGQQQKKRRHGISTESRKAPKRSDLLANDKRNGQSEIPKQPKSEDKAIQDTYQRPHIQQSTPESEDLLTTKDRTGESKPEHITYLDMFRNRKLLRNTLVLSLCWFSSGFGYMGLFLVPSSFTKNIYINYFINSIVEFPGLFILLLLINRVGRRWLTMSYFGLAGVAIVAAVSILLLTSRSNETTNVIGAVTIYVGKFSISGVVAMLYIYTPELYPTNVRNIGYGITGCAGRLGAMAAPFLTVLASLAEWAPGAALSTTFILALCSLLLLPETKGKELPQTLHEFVLWEEEDNNSKQYKACSCIHVQ
ncbi:solute carrier family 22 member 8-like [Pecten maximus]|uniref:solute carrier family 22 member 8-like n=1 Tax=Pecten maximus TaxID=6579 RepID=UPI0014581481|nr:solute carrier family 22 member 8-like [Pecten maximus]